ncbi:hypothetical protein HJ590_13160 [Naumannella sp. ID2617S]|nr:hypothetical protein [Naumannella sp. ID2617S]
MSVQSFDSVRKHNTRLIRKALEGSIFVKRWEEADPEIEKVYTSATGLVIPTGYEDVGVISKKDAAKWARDTDTADVESWGYGEPTRRDVNKDISTVAFTMQESKRQVFELHQGVDLSAVRPDADGNVVIDKPGRPQAIHWRLFMLAKDGDGADAVYFLRALPRCTVSKFEDQTWGEEDEIQYGVEMTGYKDQAWGTAVREIWGGPGLDAEEMGFATA